jgi:hypothetical protein
MSAPTTTRRDDAQPLVLHAVCTCLQGASLSAPCDVGVVCRARARARCRARAPQAATRTASQLVRAWRRCWLRWAPTLRLQRWWRPVPALCGMSPATTVRTTVNLCYAPPSHRDCWVKSRPHIAPRLKHPLLKLLLSPRLCLPTSARACTADNKARIGQQGGVALMVHALHLHVGSEAVADAGGGGRGASPASARVLCAPPSTCEPSAPARAA